ncbi:hypothetical protein BDF22DRAFT_651835 [Syncephalis plumigaleata]|nr:hypothetical protein BDF22DRAFT_651835 [Syncephalis plumigaleata]
MPSLAFMSESTSNMATDVHDQAVDSTAAAAAAATVFDKDTMVTGVKEINYPLDNVKSILRAPYWGLCIIMLAIYASLLVLHCWRYHQTRTRQHVVTALALLVACVGLSLPVASGELHVVAVSFPLMSLANLLVFALPAYLLARWGRSMTTFASTLNRFAFYTGLTWSVLFSVASTIIIAAWVIVINVLISNETNPAIIVDNVRLFFTLYYTGNGMMIGGTVILAIYALCLLLKFPRYTTPGMLIKRKQIMLLVVLFTALLASSASMLLLLPYISYCVIAIYYTATLFPQTALTGFATEPCLIVIQLDTSHLDVPSIVQVSPEPMGQHKNRVSHRKF